MSNLHHLDEIFTGMVDLVHAVFMITLEMHLIFHNLIRSQKSICQSQILRSIEPISNNYEFACAQNDFILNQQEKQLQKHDLEIKWLHHLTRLMHWCDFFSLFESWQFTPELVDIFCNIMQNDLRLHFQNSLFPEKKWFWNLKIWRPPNLQTSHYFSLQKSKQNSHLEWCVLIGLLKNMRMQTIGLHWKKNHTHSVPAY